MSTQSALFPTFNLESAPEAARPMLQKVRQAFHFIPNLYGTFANSPALLEGYMALDAAFEKTGLTPTERQVVLLAASVENACPYCTAAHSTVLKHFLKSPAELVAAIRSNSPIADPKLNVLANLTKDIVRSRGQVRPETIDNFLSAGYRKEQLLEVLIGVALKTLSNYADHLSPNDLDQAFASER
jgi:uncharacterized peroxidase-related enzyme